MQKGVVHIVNFVPPRLKLHNPTDTNVTLSRKFSVRQAQREVVKIKNLDFSYWA